MTRIKLPRPNIGAPERKAGPRVAVYLRVSTDRQNADNQIPDVEAYLATMPGAVVTWYRENESAYHGNQHELARLKKDIQNGKAKYDTVVCWAFDRLTRGGSVELIKLYYFFARFGVKVISVKEEWSNVPADFVPVMLSFFGYLAQMESKRRSERIKAGVARKAKEENWTPGRQPGAKDKKRRRRAGYLRRYARVTNRLSEEDTLEEANVN